MVEKGLEPGEGQDEVELKLELDQGSVKRELGPGVDHELAKKRLELHHNLIVGCKALELE